jgi:hypothetical protein
LEEKIKGQAEQVGKAEEQAGGKKKEDSIIEHTKR